jgi:prophage antirepressor-like protein
MLLWLRKRLSLVVVWNLALASDLCQALGMAKKRTKADRLERQTEQLGKRVDRHPDEIEKKKTTSDGVNQAAA